MADNERSPNIALRSPKKEVRAIAAEEIRNAQVNAAVFPSEVEIFNEACALEGVSRSDWLREALIKLVEKHRLVRASR